MAHQLVLLPERKRKQQKTRPREECVFPKVTEQARGSLGHVGILTPGQKNLRLWLEERINSLCLNFGIMLTLKFISQRALTSSLAPCWT